MPHVGARCSSVGWVAPGLRLAATIRGRLLGAHQRGVPPCNHITPTAVPYAVWWNRHAVRVAGCGCACSSAYTWYQPLAVACHDRCCASAAPAPYHGSLSLIKPSHNELHAFLYIMMRVWTAAAAALLCGRHPRVGAVVMRPEVWLPIQILGPARGSAGVVGGAGKLCT